MKFVSLPTYGEREANRIAHMPAFSKRWEGGKGHAGARAKTWRRIERDLSEMGFEGITRIRIKTDISDLAKLIWNSEQGD